MPNVVNHGLILSMDDSDTSFLYEFQYYPDERTYSRKVEYSKIKTPGVPTPGTNYNGGDLWQHNFTAFIDGLESIEEDFVLNNVKFLESLTYPRLPSNSSDLSKQQFAMPPVVKLILDGRYFCGVMDSIEVVPMMNFANGSMARAEVKCTFMEVFNSSISNALYQERMSVQSNWNSIKHSDERNMQETSFGVYTNLNKQNNEVTMLIR